MLELLCLCFAFYFGSSCWTCLTNSISLLFSTLSVHSIVRLHLAKTQVLLLTQLSMPDASSLHFLWLRSFFSFCPEVPSCSCSQALFWWLLLQVRKSFIFFIWLKEFWVLFSLIEYFILSSALQLFPWRINSWVPC